MRHGCPSTSMCMPFLNWFVLTVSAISAPQASGLARRVDQILRKPVRFSMPSCVTTTSSSMRTPNLPGEVDARLDRDDVPGREHVVGLRRHPRRLVDVEAETVTEPVPERAREPAVLDDAPRAASASTPGMPARIASSPASWARGRRRRPPSPRRRAGRSRTCACSRTRSRRRCSPRRSTTSSPVPIVRSPARACGCAPVGPGADDRLEREAVAALLVEEPRRVPRRPRARCGRRTSPRRGARRRGR